MTESRFHDANNEKYKIHSRFLININLFFLLKHVFIFIFYFKTLANKKILLSSMHYIKALEITRIKKTCFCILVLKIQKFIQDLSQINLFFLTMHVFISFIYFLFYFKKLANKKFNCLCFA